MPEPLIEVVQLRKVYRARGSSGDVVAVDDVSFAVHQGESVAIVGESGSGKTTTARIIVGLEHATSGGVAVCGRERLAKHRVASSERRRRGREVQMVFQDPYVSLDPRQRARDGILEVLDLHFRLTEAERVGRLARLLDQVGLDERQGRAHPAKLSGGQRQRVAIARALAPEPRAVILDEAVAALDVSIQGQVLNLLADIRDETGISYLFVSHDLAVVRQVTDRALVMREGLIVERGNTAEILARPGHPYTQLLVASVPRPGWKPERAAALAAKVEFGPTQKEEI